MLEIKNVNGPSWEGISWSTGPEVNLLLEFLIGEGFIEQTSMGSNYRILPRGIIYLEDLSAKTGEGERAFVAMWFGDEVEDLWTKGLEPAIRAAGYIPIRIDKREFEGKVDDEIVAQIRRSRFMVADCTGQRGGVYYESGLAQGLGMPVYWTCRKDHMEGVHFDTNHFRFTLWEDDKLDELMETLQKRIEADIGHGPVTPVESS